VVSANDPLRPDLTESRTEEAREVRIDLGVRGSRDRQTERIAHRGECNMSVVQDDRAGLDDPCPELRTPNLLRALNSVS
jgi:hypothetical protein